MATAADVALDAIPRPVIVLDKVPTALVVIISWDAKFMYGRALPILPCITSVNSPSLLFRSCILALPVFPMMPKASLTVPALFCISVALLRNLSARLPTNGVIARRLSALPKSLPYISCSSIPLDKEKRFTSALRDSRNCCIPPAALIAAASN